MAAERTAPRPVILITPGVSTRGAEFKDTSISLSDPYADAVLDAGGLPLVAPPSTSEQVVAEYVALADGVLLSGGEDVAPELYGGKIPDQTRRTLRTTPDGGRRDCYELLLIAEVFKQGKPLFAICRGHQLLNVALGGTLIADIPSQVPGAINHRRMDKRSEVVHEVQLTPDSLLAKMTGTQVLGVNSTHHQAVGRVAELLVVSGASLDGVVEAMEQKPGSGSSLPFLLSVQFHPERLARRLEAHRQLFLEFTRACARLRANL